MWVKVSVTNHSRRISRGVRELGPHFLKWPDDNRQAVISDNIEAKSGLRLCLGSGDGSHVNQTSEPRQFGYMYQNRKQRFSVRGTTVLAHIQVWLFVEQVNIQATVDHECRFTSYEMGWPGSVPDMKIWKQSHLWTHRHQYFKNGRYILVDRVTIIYTNICTNMISLQDILLLLCHSSIWWTGNCLCICIW